MKATLTRLGIRNVNPKLKNAPDRLEHVRTPEGEPIPPNTLAELRRDMERKRLVHGQKRGTGLVDQDFCYSLKRSDCKNTEGCSGAPAGHAGNGR
jgi:hypothetical protein